MHSFIYRPLLFRKNVVPTIQGLFQVVLEQKRALLVPGTGLLDQVDVAPDLLLFRLHAVQDVVLELVVNVVARAAQDAGVVFLGEVFFFLEFGKEAVLGVGVRGRDHLVARG